MLQRKQYLFIGAGQIYTTINSLKENNEKLYKEIKINFLSSIINWRSLKPLRDKCTSVIDKIIREREKQCRNVDINIERG